MHDTLLPMNKNPSYFLFGNTYPFPLIRGWKVEVEPISMGVFHEEVKDTRVLSYWGHENTRKAAEEVAGMSLKPRTERPALHLSKENLPMLDGEVFDRCYLLSPDSCHVTRPDVGCALAADTIVGWTMLRMHWKTRLLESDY